VITVKFNCGGCDKTVDGTTFLSSHFHGITGDSYGFGHWKNDKAEDVCPEGWIAFDPYTRGTYCPECWAEIISDEPIKESA